MTKGQPQDPKTPGHATTAAAAEPPEVAALRQASAGLTYPSESDEPFEPFAWPIAGPNDSARAQVLARSPKGAAVAEQTVDEFFSQLTGTPDAAKYADLRRAVDQQLDGARVLRVGEVRVAVYLVGKAKSGPWWSGLKTVSVET